MMRTILRDAEVTELLKATLEAHALRSIQELFDIRTGPMLTDEYWNEHDSRLRETDKKVSQLRRAANRKLALLKHLAKKLGESECDGTFDLPELEDNLLPSLRFPPSA
jgi:hypothetical protein